MHERLSGIRRSTYTGENRCWPCTVVNAILLTITCTLLAIVSPPIAVAVGIVGSTVIWLRGYLVPYTPQFAPRLVEPLPWDVFHESDFDVDPSGSTSRSLTDVQEGTDGETVLQALVDADVVTDDGNALVLADSFWTRWTAEMARLRELEDESLARAATTAVPSAETADVLDGRDRRYVVLSDGSGTVAGEHWLQRPRAIAEIGAVRVLHEVDVDFTPEQRVSAASSLCLFLTACPVCGGEVSERAAGGCCGPPDRTAEGDLKTALVCDDCGCTLHVLK